MINDIMLKTNTMLCREGKIRAVKVGRLYVLNPSIITIRPVMTSITGLII